MWKEIVDIDGFNEMALLREQFGCAENNGGEVYLHNIENKIDCHYYQYKSETIELIKGYKQLGDTINIITFVIKAETDDYPEALRLMAEHAKEYLKDREMKTFVINYGYDDENQMNNANIGIGIMGYGKAVEIFKEELEKIGFTISFTNKQLKYELI